MRSTTTLLYAKPYLQSILNTWFQRKSRHKIFIRLSALSLFVIIILMGLREQFLGQQANAETVQNFNLFNPILLQIYWSLLFIAGSISAVFQIYQSKKTDYILSHPFYARAYYLSAIFQLALSLGFISLTIGLPLWIMHLKMSVSIISIGSSLLALLAINFSAATCAVLVGLIIGPLVMHTLGRKIFLGLIFTAVFAVFLFSARLQDPAQRDSLTSNFKSLNQNSQPEILILPFSGLSKISLANLPTLQELLISLTLLSLPLFLGIFLVNNYFHRLYEISQNFRNKTLKTKSFLVKLFSLLPWKNQTVILISKEYQLLLRDALNIFQLLLIVLVMLVYILSLLNLPPITMNSSGSQELLQSVLLAVNYLAVLLIVSVIAARFVFPAFSLENGSFWLITSSALNLRTYYQAKFIAWFLIIMLIACGGLLTSNFIILRSWPAAALLALPALFTVYGILALAFSLGAFFIKLDWENITDLTSGFGNFLYLLSSFIFIILNLIPTIFLILLQSYALSGEMLNYSLNEVFFYASILLLIIYFNLLTGKFCCEFALRSIERRILT